VREWDELLSVFPNDRHDAADHVLRDLIDARLLTSYEIQDEEASSRRVEIVHESLLVNWPRLVGWQTQDADAAQLRDQLRQAARTWEEHGRTDDTLWTGAAYREFSVWRERYPGRLTETEEAFSAAMTSLATRRRRRRRFAATAILALALVITAVFGALWRSSVLETRRAEAAKLLALARLQFEKDPTEALAYATSSLELADTTEGRIFALRTLSGSSPYNLLIGGNKRVRAPVFSPDGRWLAAAGHAEEALVWPGSGGDPVRLPGHIVSPRGSSVPSWWSSNYLVTGNPSGERRVRLWSIPEGRLVRTIDFEAQALWQVGKTHLLAKVGENIWKPEPGLIKLQRWGLPDGELEELGSVDLDSVGAHCSIFDPSGRGWIYASGRNIYYRPLQVGSGEPDRILGRHENEAHVYFVTQDEPYELWSRDGVTGERRCWSLTDPSLEPLYVVPPLPDPKYRYLVRYGIERWCWSKRGGDTEPMLRDLTGLSGSRPIPFKRNTDWYMSSVDIHPSAKWIVSSGAVWNELAFWPLTTTYPSVVEGFTTSHKPIAFSPNGRSLVTAWDSRVIRIWQSPTGDQGQPLPEEFNIEPMLLTRFAFDSDGKRFVRVGFGRSLAIITIDGHQLRHLEGFSNDHLVYSAAFSPSGRLVAAGTGYGTAEEKVLRVWNLESGDVEVLPLQPSAPQPSETEDSGHEYGIGDVAFLDESTLLTAGWNGVRSWDLGTGLSKFVAPGQPNKLTSMTLSADRTTMVTRIAYSKSDPPKAIFEVRNLVTGTVRPLSGFGFNDWLLGTFVIDPGGEVLVTGDVDGTVRVGRIEGHEPHLLLGHEDRIYGVAISPDLRWIASSSGDQTLRLWQMPDLSKPPLHTLPRSELIAKLKTLTNLRVVRDEKSSTGWKLTHYPFPGWETVPSW
jgi:WD40 repeat protein